MIGGYTKRTMEEMPEDIVILNKIINSKLIGIMLHDDLQKCFDFLNLRGYKRQQEFRTLDEMGEYKGLCRYLINVKNVFPMDSETERIKINDEILKNRYRNEINSDEKKKMIKELFHTWEEWEEKTILELEEYTTALAKNNNNIDAKVTKKLLEDTTKELKYIRRHIIELNDIDYSLHHIYEMQDEIHEKYKDKTEKEIKINFC